VRTATVVAVTATIALLWIPSACASTVTNRDSKDHKVTVIAGGTAKDHVLRPFAALEGACKAGCVIRLNDSTKDEYELKSSDVVSIEDGYLYYDGPPASAVPKADDADQPFVPGAQ
jgi:hypothetical protein